MSSWFAFSSTYPRPTPPWTHEGNYQSYMEWARFSALAQETGSPTAAASARGLWNSYHHNSSSSSSNGLRDNLTHYFNLCRDYLPTNYLDDAQLTKLYKWLGDLLKMYMFYVWYHYAPSGAFFSFLEILLLAPIIAIEFGVQAILFTLTTTCQIILLIVAWKMIAGFREGLKKRVQQALVAGL